jgi:hypothetical protein
MVSEVFYVIEFTKNVFSGKFRPKKENVWKFILILWRTNQHREDLTSFLTMLKNNNFLSYKDFKLIVSDKVYNTKPTYGWTLEMLMESKILPNYHMFVLELPSPEYIEK